MVSKLRFTNHSRVGVLYHDVDLRSLLNIIELNNDMRDGVMLGSDIRCRYNELLA